MWQAEERQYFLMAMGAHLCTSTAWAVWAKQLLLSLYWDCWSSVFRRAVCWMLIWNSVWKHHSENGGSLQIPGKETLPTPKTRPTPPANVMQRLYLVCLLECAINTLTSISLGRTWQEFLPGSSSYFCSEEEHRALSRSFWGTLHHLTFLQAVVAQCWIWWQTAAVKLLVYRKQENFAFKVGNTWEGFCPQQKGANRWVCGSCVRPSFVIFCAYGFLRDILSVVLYRTDSNQNVACINESLLPKYSCGQMNVVQFSLHLTPGTPAASPCAALCAWWELNVGLIS